MSPLSGPEKSGRVYGRRLISATVSEELPLEELFARLAPALESGPFLLSSVLPLGSHVLEIAGLAVIRYSLYRE